MKKLAKEYATTIIPIAVFILALFFFGFFIGYAKGIDAHIEMVKKVQCESKYSDKPLYEVPAECFKYFNIPKGGI